MNEVQQWDHDRSKGRLQLPELFAILVTALVVRSLTGYFVGTHLNDAGWFPYGIYNVFDEQARAVLDGRSPVFWISDASQTSAATYPPGYPIWLTIIYGISGLRSIYLVQVIQIVLDSGAVLMIAGLATAAYSRCAGIAAGSLAALSPLLAYYGAAPLADAPTSWIVVGGVWMLLLAAQRESVRWAIGAGLMIGASCWFRANALMLAFIWSGALLVCMRAVWSRGIAAASALMAAALLVMSPVIIRNSIIFEAFVPTGLGAGTNLWEGIGETSRAAEFGAVYGDVQLLEQERAELALPDDERVSLYWPDGVERDRKRMKRAVDVIASQPVWYLGVMGGRMMGLLKFAGEDSGIYGTTGVNITPARTLPPGLRNAPTVALVTVLGWTQSVLRFAALPLMLFGIGLAASKNGRMTLLILATVFYYLVVGSALHTEIRYSLPMPAVLFVFAGVSVAWLVARMTNRQSKNGTIRDE